MPFPILPWPPCLFRQSWIYHSLNKWICLLPIGYSLPNWWIHVVCCLCSLQLLYLSWSSVLSSSLPLSVCTQLHMVYASKRTGHTGHRQSSDLSRTAATTTGCLFSQVWQFQHDPRDHNLNTNGDSRLPLVLISNGPTSFSLWMMWHWAMLLLLSMIAAWIPPCQRASLTLSDQCSWMSFKVKEI